ncbi:MAG: tRNA uridine-5-carboxymethylaminomethyl(34) synthesis enzyme MnmG, partial [Gemmatimonadales bacterium]
YRRAVRALLERQPNLSFMQGTVAGFRMDGNAVAGVTTADGRQVRGRSVVVTAGTFLRGSIHMGRDTRISAGRAGDAPSVELAQVIAQLGLTVERFKTGTPPRIDGRTVDFSRITRQDGDPDPIRFSFYERASRVAQLPCWLTWAGPEVKEVIERHLHESALYGGAISGRGPRYCPSVEDKIVKFPDAERHQVFLEPEGLETSEMYVNGLSTSLPVAVQIDFLQKVPGLESVRMTRPGYAIEYDYFPPTQLEPTLAVREVPGLFFAGQINGTTGYEEAAGQGLVAGLNAARTTRGKEPVVLRRDQAFIGVLVDDLVSRGVDEPYRLFTSRAEYRLTLRQDNALRRLFPLAASLDLLGEGEIRVAEETLEGEERIRDLATATAIGPTLANQALEEAGSNPITEPARISELARRPRVALAGLLHAAGHEVEPECALWAQIEFKYAGYLTRERESADRLGRMDDFHLPTDLPFMELQSVSREAREKLDSHRPRTLGQASRIPGISPSDLQGVVMEVLKKQRVASRE